MSDISAQLVEQVLTAKTEKQQLQIIGRGSKDFYGREPAGDPIHTNQHKGIVSYQPTELVMTVRAGTTLCEIDTALEENNQMLACDPPRFNNDGSIGGSLACNFSGPGRPWTGSLRDMVLGVRLINGNGEHLRFGGQVMKNVAGYDVSRLQAGALGCLGVITEVSVKIMPKPAFTATLTVNIDNQEDAIVFANTLAGQSNYLTAACWINGKQTIRFQGASRAVDKEVSKVFMDYPEAQVIPDGDEFWQALRDHKLDFFGGDEPLWRFSVKATTSITECDKAVIDWGGAQRWLRGHYKLKELAAKIPKQAGEVSLFRGRCGTENVFPPMEAVRKTIHKRLKTSFDPNYLFNPGRLYSWLESE